MTPKELHESSPPTDIELADLQAACNAIPEMGNVLRRLLFHQSVNRGRIIDLPGVDFLGGEVTDTFGKDSEYVRREDVVDILRGDR